MKLYRMPFFLALTAGVMLILVGCVSDHDLAGATTETTNGIAGAVVNRNGKPALNTIVKLFPDDYNPVSDSTSEKNLTDTTDAEGKYSFLRIGSGRYSILASNRDSLTGILIKNVSVCEDSVTRLATKDLVKTGSITIEFSKDDSIESGSFVYIPGTDIYSVVKSDSSVFIGDIPSGIVPAIVLTSSNGKKQYLLRNSITIIPEDTVVIRNPLWKFARRIILNTSVDGAGVTGDVYNFPVLVRLDAGNFDFTQTRPDGGDIMFTGNGDSLLPFEIERWDSAGSHAEIWVKVDTIYGNSSDQPIMMYWGTQSMRLLPKSGGVFDTADGFQGIWHLGDAANDSILDATLNRYNGGSPDTACPSTIEGVIGKCHQFDGSKTYITMPNTANSKLNFPAGSNYSVSAWVFFDAFDQTSRLVVSKGYEQYYLRLTYFPSNTPFLEFVEFNETSNWQTSTFPASSGQWILITGVRQGNKQFLYCNEVLVDSTVDLYPNGLPRNTTNDLSIGKFLNPVTFPLNDGYCYFKGSIDEVRITSTTQSQDWVRLCYMNQRIDGKFVVFK